MSKDSFDWDPEKDLVNQIKHDIPFSEAQYAFADPNRVISEDLAHSNKKEKRYFCFGKVGGSVMAVRFAYRAGVILIFGAGYWRKGKKIYEHEN